MTPFPQPGGGSSTSASNPSIWWVSASKSTISGLFSPPSRLLQVPSISREQLQKQKNEIAGRKKRQKTVLKKDITYMIYNYTVNSIFIKGASASGVHFTISGILQKDMNLW